MNKQFSVKVDDNFHPMEESERYDAGSYATLEEAVRKCQQIMIASLREQYEKGMTAGKLMAQWATFGEDPFIVGPEAGKPPFSARAFITEDLCAEVIQEIEGA